MRCAAAAVAYSQRENRLMEEYGMWMLEWMDTVFGVTLREEYGFGHKRLQRAGPSLAGCGVYALVRRSVRSGHGAERYHDR